jgi:dTDP-4-amino-4,6-dideoxygalactose transaminase
VSNGIPLLDLKRQYAQIGDKIEAAVIESARSTQYILGKTVSDFEEQAAAYCGADHAIGVTSGSDALIVALMAEGIGLGDEVICPPFTFFATAGAIHRVGARPVFVDIEPVGFNLDPELLEAAINKNTRAIVPVHLFGQAAEMDAIMRIAEKHGLCVIEDGAQAIGSEYKGRRVGSIGHYGCFSFFPSKNLGCLGDGGLVTTNDPDRNAKVRMLRNHGMEPKYYHEVVGGNFRIDALQAAVLSVKLPYLDGWTEGRQENATRYRELFAQAEIPGIELPTELSERRHIYNQFTIRIGNGRRDVALTHLREKNIGCDIYYPVPLHMQKCFADLGGAAGDFPVSERAAAEVLSIPIFPELSGEELATVVDQLAAVLK